VRKVAPPSVATALASIVLPVPGGPKSNTPLTASEATPSCSGGRKRRCRVLYEK